MYVMEEKKDGFKMFETMGFKNTSLYSTLSDIDIERLTNLGENVRNAFSESERQNDEKIFTIKNHMINKTVETIIDLENQNDQRIKDMVNSMPNYKDYPSEITVEPSQFSFDMISDLR